MAKQKRVTNMVQLRDSLLDTYNELKSGEIGVKEAKETANVAGKVIASVKTQLDYYAFTKQEGKIAFMDC